MSDSETIVWEGSPSHYHQFGTYLWCILLCVLVFPALYGIWCWIELKSQKFQLSNQRLKWSRGVLSRVTDEIELYRIKDTQLVEPFFLRLVGCGNIILATSDRSTHEMILPAINKAGDVREKIRSLVEIARRERGVREVDFSGE